MPQPTASDVHVNRPLTNVSQAYMQDNTDYVADKIFPIVPVQKQSDLYFTYTKNDWFRDETEKRAPGTESAGGGYRLSTTSYYADVWAFHKDVDAQVRANTDDPLNADRDATMFVTQRLALTREVQTLAAVFKTSTWTGSSTGADITVGTKWDAANSTPLEDIETEIWAMKAVTGKFPNRLVLGTSAWKALKNNSELLTRIQYTQRGIVSTDIVASLIAPPGVTDFQVLVGAAIKATNAEGATDAYAYIVPKKNAVLLHSPASAGIQTAASGYIFTWVGLLGAGAFGTRISTIAMPWLGQETVRVEGELAFTCLVIGADLGVYFTNATNN